MAARLTDWQKKEIIADYVNMQSYNAVGKKHGVAGNTVKRIVAECQGIEEKIKEKKNRTPPTSSPTWTSNVKSCARS